MKKIRKAVIAAAGFGTRMLPVTKAQPKEMLPVVDKPIIQYIVEEAVASGIEEIVIVIGGGKHSIEDHFDYNFELEHHLLEHKKNELYDQIRNVAQLAHFVFIRQKGPYGNGTPFLEARNLIGNEPFAAFFGDDFIYATPPRLKQMIDVYEENPGVVISGVRIDKPENLSKYGVADITPWKDNIVQINHIVEKPAPHEAPSNLALIGSYILPPEIFTALEEVKPGKGGEIWLVDGINKLKEQGIPLYGCEVKNGTYYDCGTKLEYIKTNIHFALHHTDMQGELKEFLKELVKEFD